MAHINDAQYDALKRLGFEGSTSDMTKEWLRTQGAEGFSTLDLWLSFLANEGFTTGKRNDRFYAYLGSLGFEGAYNDRALAYWESLGVEP